jgi:arylsulfatase A-like enzyme
MGHRFGDGTTFYDAIRRADCQIKKIWDAVKLRENENRENWLLIVTTDHGRDASTGKDHGGQSERERTSWIALNKKTNDRFQQSPGVVDILPSILNHLNVAAADDIKRELDGVPFIGDVDMSELTATKQGDSVSVTWKNLSDRESDRAEIFYSVTNRFKDGMTDKYEKAGEALLHEESFNFTCRNASSFLKILVKGPHHYENVWIDDTVD